MNSNADIKSLQFFLKNTEKALSIINEVDASKLNLANYGRVTLCGTLFCTLGWIAQGPYFHELGIRTERIEDEDGVDWSDYYRIKNDTLPRMMTHNAVTPLFGEYAWTYLFSQEAQSPYDAQCVSYTHKDLAINRLQMHIKRLETNIAQYPEVASNRL